MKNTNPFKSSLMILLFCFGLTSLWGQAILVDDFNRANNNTVGNDWTEIETTSGAQITSNMLQLGSTTTGREFVYKDLSSLTNPIITNGITNNNQTLTWAFNFRTNRNNPSGFDASNYGISFILCKSTNDLTNGVGYAITIGGTTTNDPIKLVRFSGGGDSNSEYTDIIVAPTNSGIGNTAYISVRVTYNPLTDEWALFAEANASNFPQSDPRNTATQIGNNIVNTTYTATGNNLRYFGAYWNHSNGAVASNNAIFDDIYAPALQASGDDAPELTAAENATVDAPFNVTFTDDEDWREAITGITVGGTPLTAGWSVSAGQITFTPSASVPAGLLQTAGDNKSIVVSATDYSNATVNQTIIAGVATKLAITQQPTAPASNGAALAIQPKVTIQDQYGNKTTNTANVTAAATQGTWTLGGTVEVAAINGEVTYSGLTATSAEAVSGATISFSADDLTGVTSGSFNIPSPPPPPPANDNPSGAINLTIGNPAVQGTNINSTKTIIAGLPNPASPCAGNYTNTGLGVGDVWYTITVPESGEITITTSAPTTGTGIDTVIALYTVSGETYTQVACDDDNGGNNYSMVTYSGTPGVLIYIRIWEYNNDAAGNFNIRATTPPTNNGCTTPVVLTVNAEETTDGTLAGSTPTISTQNDVWYSFTPNYAGSHTITVGGFTGNVDIRLYSVSCGSVTNSNHIAAAATSNNPENLTYNITTPNQPYLIRVFANNAAANASNFNIQVTSPKSITTDVNTVAFGSVDIDTEEDATSDVDVTGVYLTGNITATLGGTNADQFSVSEESLDAAGGTLTVTYNPDAIGTHAATLTLSSAGATDKVVNLSGTAVIVPVVEEDTFAGTVGIAFSEQIEATQSPASYAITYGELPEGLSLNTTTGAITGTPLEAGDDFEIQVTATNAAGTSEAKAITFEIGKGTQAISGFNNLNKTTNDTPFGLPETTNAELTVSYESSNTSVATIDGNTVTIMGAGSTTITASQAGNDNWNALPEETTIILTVTEVYAGEGVFEKITDINDLTDGYYVIVGTEGSVNNAMNNSAGSGFLNVTGVTVADNKITDPATSIVWKIETNGDYKTIYNDVVNQYVSQSGSNNSTINLVNAATGNNQYWNATYTGSLFNFASVATSTRSLAYNIGASPRRFAGYQIGTQQINFSLYKLIIPAGPITWTGTEWSNGDGPDPTDPIIVEGELVIGEDADMETLEVGDLTVAEGGSIVIEAGHSITINGKITNNADAENFIVRSGANLIQSPLYTANDNEGAIAVERESQDIVRLDYTLWSSPVIGQQLQAFSPMTLPNRIYTYETTEATEGDDGEYVVVADANANFENGKGYLFRAPNNWNLQHDNAPTPYQGNFIGEPFNGNINIGTYANGYTSVGNPYPSNLDPQAVMDGNDDINTLYFWNNPERVFNETTETWEYNGIKYVTYSGLGFVPDIYNGNSITVGQGFIVYTTANSVNFTNDMRVSDAGDFFKADETERHRIWLNLSNGENRGYNQMLVGYMTGATNNIDNQIDGKMFGYEGSALYNIIGEEKFVIQGRALPFEASDVVPLGFRAKEAGTFIISLANFDGLFAEGEVKVYLKDRQAHTIHNLMESDYVFESAAGEFKERFEVVYGTDEIMGTGDLTSNSVQIYRQDQNIVVSSKSEKILSVELYDLQGRNIHRNDRVNVNHYQIRSEAKGVLVVKVQTQNGEVVTKKVINK